MSEVALQMLTQFFGHDERGGVYLPVRIQIHDVLGNVCHCARQITVGQVLQLHMIPSLQP